MNKINWARKLSSRKLWAAAAGVVTGLAMVFGLDQEVISTVAGAVVSVASVIAYIITEGKVDAQGVSGVITDIQKAVDAVQGTGVVVSVTGDGGVFVSDATGTQEVTNE